MSEQKKTSTNNSLEQHLKTYEQNYLPQLLAVHNISPAQFTGIVLSLIKKSADLQTIYKQNPASLFASILAGAEIGLIPSDFGGEFFIIPRNLKQSDGSYKLTACPQIGYMGLVKILMRSGKITRINTEVVYKDDEFKATFGLEPNIIHVANLEGSRTANDIVGCYAYAKMTNGEYQIAVMTRKEMDSTIAMQKNPNELYFNDKKNPNRWMERKLVLVQLSKLIPKDFYNNSSIMMDSALSGDALITLDENNKIKIIEGTPIKQTKYRNIYGTLANLPERPKDEIISSPILIDNSEQIQS